MSRSGDSGFVEDHPVDELCTSSTLTYFYHLLRDGKYSDMTIVCRGREFKAHRAVVCTQSVWFERAFTTPPKKRIVKRIELEGVDPDVFQRFLEFLYTGTYTLESETPSRDVTTPKTDEILSILNDYPRCTTDTTDSEPVTEDTSKRPVRRSSRLNSSAEPTETIDVESQEATEDSSDSSLLRGITMSLGLYQLAVKYNVPALQLLARERFYSAAKARWLASWEGSSFEDTREFEEVVLDIYTLQHDEPIWKAVRKLIKAKTEDDVMKDRMWLVWDEHEDLKTGMSNHKI
ncbi:hypothetical protein FLONG3_355 [Fusarium longipes]|uniref:BTB domain-containing protein n=1 Tax=Fusarium longipes TaxID=694270 RepID=A0A395TAI6_9HYPO|nr:hypothetical protein FLONG3_355 [Fusarium longipes]